jgi:uncharacterized cupin superfamily protein
VIAHWDDVEGRRREKGEMAVTWHRLGDAAGTVGVGVNRALVEPERLSTPPHSHGASEELIYVLGGSGLAWQDEAVFEIGPGDCVVFRANEAEHTLRGGRDGLDVLIYGTRHPTEYGWLPRSKAVRLSWPWLEGRTDDPWDVEAEAEPLDFSKVGDRPPNVVNAADTDPAWRAGERRENWRDLASTAGSETTGLNWVRLGSGQAGSPPHCHSEEEEVFVILEGSGTLELWPAPIMEERGLAVREDHAVRAGHVIARPPATRVAHRLLGGADGMTYLAYGTRRPNDIAYYPRSRKVFFRGLGVIGRVEHLEYWDGEERDM